MKICIIMKTRIPELGTLYNQEIFAATFSPDSQSYTV